MAFHEDILHPAALDRHGWFGQVPAMAQVPDPDGGEIAGTPRRKHRHDLGHEDHGPVVTAGTTRTIQILLGLWIALTLVLVVYALVDGSRARDGGAMSDTPAKTE